MEGAIDLAQRLWLAIDKKTWGLEGIDEAVVTNLENLSTPDPETYGLAWFNLSFSYDVLFYPSDFEQEVGTLREMIINNSVEV